MNMKNQDIKDILNRYWKLEDEAKKFIYVINDFHKMRPKSLKEEKKELFDRISQIEKTVDLTGTNDSLITFGFINYVSLLVKDRNDINKEQAESLGKYFDILEKNANESIKTKKNLSAEIHSLLTDIVDNKI
jgi:hypothetical protein